MRAPLPHQSVRPYVTDQETDWIDEAARSSPTALTMALERAIATGDRALERAVLAALGRMGRIRMSCG